MEMIFCWLAANESPFCANNTTVLQNRVFA